MGGEIFFIRRTFYSGIQETRKGRHWKWATLSTGAPVGEFGGGSFTGRFGRQMKDGSGKGASLIKLIWAPFLWIQIMLGA